MAYAQGSARRGKSEQRMLKQATAKTARTGSLARLHAVNRAVGDLRRGDAVLLRHGDDAALIQAAETIDDAGLARAAAWTGSPAQLATTRRRAVALDLAPAETASAATVVLNLPADVDAIFLNELADPTVVRQVPSPPIALEDAPAHSIATAAIELAKLARLLPAVALFAIETRLGAVLARREGIVELSVASIEEHRSVLARGLRRVADARVPLADAENARIVAFRPDDGGIDHLAIVIGNPQGPGPVLTRIHSECFTGDLLGSLRCDCGEQLRGAIRAIAEAGDGIVIYLAQEGRGIGLVNKLRAYRLQDTGFDTVDANEQLGFEADERVYQPAAEILRQLGFDSIRLLTNNPAKFEGVQRYGIAVTERVSLSFTANDHNRHYLQTKQAKSGHLL
jgi:GTP cyclohydrolase II